MMENSLKGKIRIIATRCLWLDKRKLLENAPNKIWKHRKARVTRKANKDWPYFEDMNQVLSDSEATPENEFRCSLNNDSIEDSSYVFTEAVWRNGKWEMGLVLKPQGVPVNEIDRDWANIGSDPLSCIAEKTHSIQDRVRLGAVCQSWHASLGDKKIDLPICLMLAEKEKSDSRCFYNISEENSVELELPEIRGRRCWGSAFGWLVTCGLLDLEIQLFNPLSRASLPLPSFSTFTHQQNRPSDELCKFFITKLILSSSPASPDCIVLAIYSEFFLLGFAKPGDQSWVHIDGSRPFDDAICFNGNFFAARNTGEVFICQGLDGPHPRVEEFASAPPTDAGYQKYIVDLGGNLCLLSRIVDPYMDKVTKVEEDLTNGFEIIKLDMETRNWEKILSLGDFSLFMGSCYTFSVVAADYPGCTPNCIYFTDDSPGGEGVDIGIFDCSNFNSDEEEEYPIDPFPESDDVQDLLSSFSPPVWLALTRKV
ncbi:hypothetical protein CCACVL1_01161 [Corchorus capsularis]|uniref:KIB1-4 beta-propeller domain-containing protein n=1 Tax=Corchorus capsularis TaxID=210143 RepID=A0A1R3KLX1_COCAP|nr:hypothetical protein CCACVL1_01161 [Corchorus capsularis]